MDAVLHWLLDSDPAIRWQVLRDLTDAPADRVAAERARVAREGWGAQLLALQGDDGQWAGGACFPAGHFDAGEGSGDGSPAADPAEQVWTESPEADDDAEQPWTATLPTLEVLVALGVDPADPVVRRAVGAVAQGCRWEHDGQAFFDGEVEACINGRTVALGAYFGEPVDSIVGRLVAEQLVDGGWNCWALYGATRSSFHSTICVLEGLLAHERATGDPAVGEARRRGEEYLLERRLLHRATTGEVIKPRWLDFAFPTYWHYDLLRGLAYFRDVGGAPDPRLHEAVEILRARRQPDGTWLLDHVHSGATHLSIDAAVGQPSRWNTLRALRVLRWVDGS
jgi:hypothetical protein